MESQFESMQVGGGHMIIRNQRYHFDRFMIGFAIVAIALGMIQG
jgi:hypothetical protein